MSGSPPPRPAEICRQLLLALEASEGRRRRRKRDTTPDATGLAIKRRLLEQTVQADPDPEGFEAWLLDQVSSSPANAAESEGGGREPPGARLAMARAILEEWRLACVSPGFRAWLKADAPSDDR